MTYRRKTTYVPNEIARGEEDIGIEFDAIENAFGQIENDLEAITNNTEAPFGSAFDVKEFAKDVGFTNRVIIVPTVTPSATDVVQDGMRWWVKIAFNNSGPCQMKVGDTGFVEIRRYASNGILYPLNVGDLVAGDIVRIWFNGTFYILLNNTPADNFITNPVVRVWTNQVAVDQPFSPNASWARVRIMSPGGDGGFCLLLGHSSGGGGGGSYIEFFIDNIGDSGNSFDIDCQSNGSYSDTMGNRVFVSKGRNGVISDSDITQHGLRGAPGELQTFLKNGVNTLSQGRYLFIPGETGGGYGWLNETYPNQKIGYGGGSYYAQPAMEPDALANNFGGGGAGSINIFQQGTIGGHGIIIIEEHA